MIFVNTIRDRFTKDWRQIDWRRTLLLVLLVLAIAAALWQHFMPEVREINTTTFKRVPEIRKVREVQRVRIPCPEQGLLALDRTEAAQRLKLPELLTSSPADATSSASTAHHAEVLNTAELPASENGQHVIAILDTATGETNVVAKEAPAPWFRFTNKGAAGLRYGLNQRLEYAGTAYGRWDFLRMKDVYFSVNADLETGGDAHLQAGAEYRW